MAQQDDDSTWKLALREHMATLEGSPEAVLSALTALRSEFQAELAKVAAPAMTAEIKARDDETLQCRRAICSWANEQLRHLGLAVHCQRSGKPSFLVADPRDPADCRGRFRYEHWSEQGRGIKTFSSVTPPTLELVEDPPRKESFARWTSRDSRGPAR